MIGSTFGQYRIQEQLGQGGMGIVYRAHDEKLDRPVALKFLPQHLQSDATSKQRFIQEARAASALDDPHICTIHDIGEAEDGRLYIVMTFYDGQTLKYLLESGPLPVEQAKSVALQIAQGLRTAHEHGIVHRDIKPANIMVTRKDVVKILDFGLAKLGESSDITKAGSTLGTASYMSPEQARGGAVDRRTDLWSVGVLFYEMLTGRPPFSGGYEAAILYSILNEDIPPVSELRPDVPAEIARLITRCLEKDPEARIAGSQEIVTALGGAVEESGVSSVPMPAAYSEQSRRAGPDLTSTVTRFAALAVLILGASYAAMIFLGLPGWVFPLAVLFVLAGFPVVLYGFRLERARSVMQSGERRSLKGLKAWLDTGRALQGGLLASATLVLIVVAAMGLRAAGVGPFATLITSGALDREDTFVVADFNNRTSIDGLGDTVTEAFRIDLSRSDVVNLLDRSAIQATLELMQLPPDTAVTEPVANEIAVRRGAAAVVSGDIQPAGAGFVLTAHVSTASDGGELVALRENAADDASILQAIDRLSSRLREEIGESLVSIRAGEPLESVTTASLDALREYSRGDADASRGRIREAIRHMQRAIELDSTFAMAYRKLAVLHGNAGDAFGLQIKAIRKGYALRDNLPERERLLTEAYYYNIVLDDDDRVRSAYEAVLDRYPNDVTALNNLAIVYGSDRRYEDALALVRRALQTAEGFTFRSNVLDNLIVLGRLDEAEQELATFDEALPGNALVPTYRVAIAYLNDDFSTAYAWVDSITGRENVDFWKRRATLIEAGLRGAQGQMGELKRLSENARGQRIASGDTVGAMFQELGAAFGQIGLNLSNDEVRGELDRILSKYDWESYPERAKPYVLVAAMHAWVGDLDEARQWMQRYRQNVPEELQASNQFADMVDAFILAREGNFAEAIPGMETAYEESGCVRCFQDVMGIIYQAAGQTDKASAALERFANAPTAFALANTPTFVGPALERLADLYEQAGETDKAIEALARLVQRWQDADDVLQPRVQAAEARLEELLLQKAREPDPVG